MHAHTPKPVSLSLDFAAGERGSVSSMPYVASLWTDCLNVRALWAIIGVSHGQLVSTDPDSGPSALSPTSISF